MTSDPPPPNSISTFDALWESLDEESDIPPAIDPNAAGRLVPRQQRDTLLPPMPPPEYVQTMMELGEIDDPSEHPPPLRAGTPRPPAAGQGRSTGSAVDRRTPIGPEPKAAALGLVMASESELILPGDDAGSFEEAPMAQRAPIPPPPRPATLHGGRRLTGTNTAPRPAPLPGVGTPRAPSIPPPPMSVRTFDELDGLDGLPFTAVVDTGEERPPPNRAGGTSFEAFFGGRSGKPKVTTPVRTPTPPPFHGATTAPVRLRAATPTPFALDDDPTPMRASRPPPRRAMTPPIRSGHMTPPPQNAAGLRLGKLPPASVSPPAQRQQRDTPVQDLGVYTRPTHTGSTSSVPARATPEPVHGGAAGGPTPRAPAEPTPIEESGPSSTVNHARRMAERLSARDYRGALVEAEGLLAVDPQNLDAKRCAESCREMLAQKYLGSLGGLEQIPRALMPPEEIRWLSLDHRAGFLLSFVDGAMSIEEVLDVSSMAELDALQIMYELREQGVIEIAAPARRPGRRQ